MEVAYQGSSPLCMSQFKTLLGTARIPGLEQDTLTTYKESRHVVIISNGHYFSLSPIKEDNQLIDAIHISNTINLIIESSATKANNPLGNLTTLDRTSWATLRNTIIELDQINYDSLKIIDSALAVIILDQSEYSSEAEMFKNMLCGNPSNRWYDKSLQFIVNKENHFAVNYEHSGVDGTTLGNLSRFLYCNMKPHKRENNKNMTNLSKEIVIYK